MLSTRHQNEKSDHIESELSKEVTTSDSGVGVPQECLPVADGQCVTLSDSRLVDFIRRWNDFLEAIRDQILALGQLPESISGQRGLDEVWN